MSSLASSDPTRTELLAFLNAKYALAGFVDDCSSQEWAVEMAAYYTAAHWHGGQGSNLYAALCASLFCPGALQDDLTGNPDADGEDCEANYLYAAANAEMERLTAK